MCLCSFVRGGVHYNFQPHLTSSSVPSGLLGIQKLKQLMGSASTFINKNLNNTETYMCMFCYSYQITSTTQCTSLVEQFKLLYSY